MFAYCNNSPNNHIDEEGKAPLKVSRYLLCHWVFGEGESLHLNKNSFVSRKLKRSKTMKNELYSQIEKYENGEEYGKGSVHFESNELDLWLGVRRASYEVEIEEETKTFNYIFFKKTKHRYVLNVKVYDTYNFNIGNEQGDGLGSWLNNLGYWAQEKNLGTEYYWEAEYVYKTKWQ